jgi:hypothetical protein
LTDLLEKLKEEMDNTVLKDVDFKEKNKAAVRKSYRMKQQNTWQKSRFPEMGWILSLSFTTLFLVCTSYFVIQQIGLTDENSDRNGKMSETDAYEKSLVTLPEPKENFDEMSKEEVLLKLLNSVDYVETAAGKFEDYNLFYDGSSSKRSIEFKMSNKNVIGGYEKLIHYPDEWNPQSRLTTDETYYNKDKTWRIETDDKRYTIFDTEIEKKKNAINPDDIFTIDIDKIYDSREKYRERPPSMTAHELLFNYEFVAKYLRYKDQWKIEKQNEELVGHNTMVISGVIDESLADIMQPNEKNFRIWVDKDTGILLKKEIYDAKGNVISYLYTKELIINRNFTEEEFKPDLDGYQEYHIENRTFLDEKESEIEVIDHADTKPSSVEKVLVKQRESIPMFYEFMDPKITVFSASIEKYHEDQQAYVVYSYDKPVNEIGSGSRLFFTRIYQKGSVVRTTGDFESELGDPVETYHLNGIDWSLYEIPGTPNYHLKGKSGEYLVEIVTQEVSLNEIKNSLENYKKSS